MKRIINKLAVYLKDKEISVYVSKSTLNEIAKSSELHVNKSGKIRRLIKIEEIKYIISARTITDQKTHKYFIRLCKRRLKRGDACFLFLDGDDCMGYLWIAIGSVYIEAVDFEMRLDNDTIAIYDVYTNERYRGAGVYRSLLMMITEYYKNYRNAQLWVMRHNKNAIYVQSKCGFSGIYVEVKLISCCGMKRYKIKEVEYPMGSLLSDG